MKTTLFLLFILCAATSFGQAVASIDGSTFRISDHPGHAETHAMAQEQPLVGGGSNTYSYAQGERPLWEFGPVAPPPTPLGDVARFYRKEKLAAKKAEIVFEKQGS